MPKLLVVDSNALIHRAYHAYPNTMRTKDGVPTNALYGFVTLLLTSIEKIKPDYVICTFDTGKPTFRHLKYVDYKSHRKAVEEDLITQFPIAQEIAKAFNIPIYSIEGYEADDLIGTIVKSEKLKDFHKIIVTGDSDEYQLVASDIDIFMAGRFFRDSKLWNAKEIEMKLGFDPIFVPDFKALKGDSSDDIPGVPGIGDKTATMLIQKFGTIENLYQNIDKVENPKLTEKLIQNHDVAIMSKDLATIDTNVPLSLNIEDAKFDDFRKSEVIKLFQKLEFRSLLKRLDKINTVGDQTMFDIASDKPKEKVNRAEYIKLDSRNWQKFIDDINKYESFAFDTETDSLDTINCNLVGISFCFNKDYAYFIQSKDINGEMKKDLKKIFSSKQLKIAHNLKFDMHALLNFGIEISLPKFDTMLADFLLSWGNGRKGLKELAFNNLGLEMTDFEQLLQNGTNGKNSKIFDVKEENLINYAAEDAYATYMLYLIYSKQFEKTQNQKLKLLFEQVEIPTVEVLILMEREGIEIDKDILQRFGKDLEKEIGKITKQIFEEIGHEFNIASSKQVGEILAEELHIPLPKKARTKAYSTDERSLKNYAQAFPICELILRFRELAKLQSTYINSLVEVIDSNNRVHTQYNQAIASTGRLSSTGPNLQNIPAGGLFDIRSSFVAGKGKILISFDYSQQELRLLAHLSKEDTLIEAFKKGQDIHKSTASLLFTKNYDDVTKEERETAKTVNFGIIYGMGAFGLSDRLKIDRHIAQKFIDDFFIKFPKIKQYFDVLIEEGKEKGYIETILGRRRITINLTASNVQIRNAAYRELINFPLQGSAADLMKKAMVEVYERVLKKNKNIKLLLQVHDELIFETDKNIDEKIIDKIKDCMFNVYELAIPLNVSVSKGSNWGMLK